MKRKGRVQWKTETMIAGPKLRPQPFHIDHTSDEMYAVLSQHLVIGSMWQTVVPLCRDTQWPVTHFEPHEFSYLVVQHYTSVVGIPAKTLAIYTGTVRVEEEKRGGRGAADTIRVSRHTFLIGDTRYMAGCLSDFTPIL